MITAIEQVDDMLVLHYERPGRSPGHLHYIPIRAIENRMAVYGSTTMTDALKECVTEALYSGSDILPTKVERLALVTMAGTIQGIETALTDAGISLDTPSAEQQVEDQQQALTSLGTVAFAGVRGVHPSTIPEVITKPLPHS